MERRASRSQFLGSSAHLVRGPGGHLSCFAGHSSKTDLGGFVLEEEGSKIGLVVAAVLVGCGSVEGVGAGSEIPFPVWQ